MDALPSPTAFRWSFNGSNADAGDGEKRGRFKRVNASAAAFVFPAASERDLGEVRCFATNSLGETERPCVYQLIRAGKMTGSS